MILLGSVALALLATGAVFSLRDHLADYWIKRQLAAQLSRALDADVDLQGVQWASGVLQARRLRVAGEQLPFTRLESRGVSALVDWRRLMEPAKEPLHVEIAEADLVWRSPTEKIAGAAEQNTNAAKLPSLDLLVGKLNFRHSDGRDWSIEGSAVRAVWQEYSWSISANGGTLAVTGWPALSVERLSAEHRDQKWKIGSFALRDGRDGVVAGSALHDAGSWSGEFSWQDLDLAALAPPEVASHLVGTASGDAVLKDGVLRGQMKISGASTKTVGLLVKLASLVDGEDWSDVPWTIFRFDFTRQADGRVEFSNLQALSSKGIAVRGSGHLAPARLGADLQVGIRREGRPYLGAFVPILFSHERDGYYWMAVKVGGTPAAPTENLSTRIVAALAVAPAAGAAESAVQVPAEAVEAVGGALRDLLRH